MRHYILFLLLIMTMEVGAQGRYCKSYNDFVTGQWHAVPSIHIARNSSSRQFWNGVGDYQITSEDKAIAKQLKKEALVVEYHDTLYVNLNKLQYKSYGFGNGYVRAIMTVNKKIAFVTKDVRANVKTYAMGQLFGVVGAAISEKNSQKNKVCYIIDNDGEKKKIKVKMLDDSTFKDALLESERHDAVTDRDSSKQ